MPQTPTATPLLATDPGFLFWAPLGSTEPTHAVTGSVFTDTWPAAWIRLGATEEGHTFNWQTSFDPVNVAELLDPVKYVTTGRTGSLAFALVDFHMNNVKRALNGGTITTTGASDRLPVREHGSGVDRSAEGRGQREPAGRVPARGAHDGSALQVPDRGCGPPGGLTHADR
jgi:hypothetical protein